MEYPIGTQFKRSNKKYVETVVDMLTTRDTSDKVVKVRYVAEHEFCGQTVTDYDVVAVTIARNLITKL